MKPILGFCGICSPECLGAGLYKDPKPLLFNYFCEEPKLWVKAAAENRVFSYHGMAGDNGKRKWAPDGSMNANVKFMNDPKELFLSEIRKAYFNSMMSWVRGYRLSHTGTSKPHKRHNLLECAYFKKSLFQLFSLTMGSSLMLSLVQVFQNWSTFQQNRTIEIWGWEALVLKTPRHQAASQESRMKWCRSSSQFLYR